MTYPQRGKWFVLFLSDWTFSQLFLTFLRKDRVWLDSAAEHTGWLLVWLPHSWPSKLLTHLCLQALYQPASKPAVQTVSQSTGWPASSVDKLLSDLRCNWRGHRLFQCFGRPLPTPNSWGISYGLSEAEPVLFIDGGEASSERCAPNQTNGRKVWSV